MTAMEKQKMKEIDENRLHMLAYLLEIKKKE
jgi:hypothetical protein